MLKRDLTKSETNMHTYRDEEERLGLTVYWHQGADSLPGQFDRVEMWYFGGQQFAYEPGTIDYCDSSGSNVPPPGIFGDDQWLEKFKALSTTMDPQDRDAVLWVLTTHIRHY